MLGPMASTAKREGSMCPAESLDMPQWITTCPKCSMSTASSTMLQTMPGASPSSQEPGVRNTHVMPSTRIPNDVIAEVLSYIDNQFWNPDGSYAMTSARLVCRRWNTVAVNTPALWTNVRIERRFDANQFPIDPLKLWLSRARALPLHVVVSFPYDPVEDISICEHFPRPLITHRRWVSYTHMGTSTSSNAIMSNCIDPSILKELKCISSLKDIKPGSLFPVSVYRKEFTWGGGREIIRPAFPVLYRLYFSGISLKKPLSFTAPNLTELSLLRVYVSLSCFAALSTDLPHIKILTIQEVTWSLDPGSESETHDWKAAKHANLKHLTFGVCSHDPHEAQLNPLDIVFCGIVACAPHLTSIDFDYTRHQFQLPLPDYPTFLPRSVTQLTVRNYSGCTISQVEPFKNFIEKFENLQSLLFCGIPAAEASDNLLPILNRTKTNDESDVLFHEVLPHLQCLELGHAQVSAHTLVNTLGARQSVNEASVEPGFRLRLGHTCHVLYKDASLEFENVERDLRADLESLLEKTYEHVANTRG